VSYYFLNASWRILASENVYNFVTSTSVEVVVSLNSNNNSKHNYCVSTGPLPWSCAVEYLLAFVLQCIDIVIYGAVCARYEIFISTQ